MSEPPGFGVFRPIAPDVTQDEDMDAIALAGADAGLPEFPFELENVICESDHEDGEDDVLPEFEDENDPDQLKLRILLLSQQLEEAQAQLNDGMSQSATDARCGDDFTTVLASRRQEISRLKRAVLDLQRRNKRHAQTNFELRRDNRLLIRTNQDLLSENQLIQQAYEDSARLAREVAVLQQEKASLETERANKNDIFQRLMTAAKQHESRHKALFAENARLTASEQALQAQNAALSERNARLEAQILQFGLGMQAAAGSH